MATAEQQQQGAGAARSLPMIEVYSTLTRKKSPLVTVQPGHVGM